MDCYDKDIMLNNFDDVTIDDDPEAKYPNATGFIVDSMEDCQKECQKLNRCNF